MAIDMSGEANVSVISLLNASSGTHFYFESESTAADGYLKGVLRSDDSSSSATLNYDGMKKIDSVTLSELNFHDLSSPPKTVEFLCTRDVGSIETANGWCCVSCSKFSSCTCAPCHGENAVGVAR
ncbi:hypothetical protein YC2023_089455 [Brassica napus]